MWIVPALEITDEERAELEARVRAHKTPQRMVRRCRIVLLAAEGVPNTRIARQVGINHWQVGQWRRRFRDERLPGLNDRSRPGRPRLYSHDDRLKIVATATSTKPDHASQWSHSLLAQELVDMGISASQIGRILADLDIKPHLVRSWLTRPDDPEFWERAADVCGLYLSRQLNTLVLSVDEKTAIAARSPSHPGLPIAPGKPERKEFEYRRHGTACLMAALDVHSGEVFAAEAERNDSAGFIDFLEQIDRQVDQGIDVHLIMDNGSSHISKTTTAWFEAHPRFLVHHTPKHASWLNQVELFFSILTRRLLKRGEFESKEELVSRIMAFIEHYNRTAKPFRWTYDGSPLKAA
ncbi:MAG: IS630 family transposase [Actinomycetota bacterium]